MIRFQILAPHTQFYCSGYSRASESKDRSTSSVGSFFDSGREFIRVLCASGAGYSVEAKCPLSAILFDCGINLLCGSVVKDINSVLDAVRQAGNFRQVHKAGVCLVSIVLPETRN